MKDFLFASVAVICADTPKSAAERKQTYVFYIQSYTKIMIF